MTCALRSTIILLYKLLLGPVHVSIDHFAWYFLSDLDQPSRSHCSCYLIAYDLYSFDNICPGTGVRRHVTPFHPFARVRALTTSLNVDQDCGPFVGGQDSRARCLLTDQSVSTEYLLIEINIACTLGNPTEPDHSVQSIRRQERLQGPARWCKDVSVMPPHRQPESESEQEMV